MEVPKKIYMHRLLTEDGESIMRRCAFQKDDMHPIEYIQTDAFIDKVAAWFANRYQANGSYLCANDIEDFVKYMKGE